MPSAFVDWVVDALTQYTQPFPDVHSLPPEPEQTFLLGNRYADYGLAVLFAFAFPLLRSILRRFLYTVRPAHAAPCGLYPLPHPRHCQIPLLCL